MEKKHKTCYICGSVTSHLQIYGYFMVTVKFQNAALFLQRLDYKTVNPMELCKSNWSWIRCMIVCLYNLIKRCDSIYVLRDYKTSRGAKIELWVAKKLKYNIIYECAIS